MNSLRSVSLVSLALVAAPLAVFAQGALTPAGSPAPTMKTLAQIEARTDVNSLSGDATTMHVITQPGSYYLTANVNGVAGKGGIRIAASDVTLDLNGFTVRGPGAGSLRGIWSSDGEGDPEYVRLTVRNGSVVNWGGSGIDAGFIRSVDFSGLRVEQSGGAGIHVPGGMARIADCSVRVATWAGIYVGTGSDVQIRDCVVCDVNGGSTAWGIFSGYGNVDNCRVRVVHGLTAKGIETGFMTGRVSHCDVSQVGATAPGANSIGISAALIEGCTIADIGMPVSSGYGVYTNYPASVLHTRVSDVRGVNAIGIYTFYGKDSSNSNGVALVQSCSVANMSAGTGAAGGISARTVLDCQISAVVSDTPSNTATGIVLFSGGLASRCSIMNVEGHGIDMGYSATATDNTISSAGSDGSGIGINIQHASIRVERNRVSGCPIGYNQAAATALVIGNYAQNNTINYNGVFAGSIAATYANVVAGGTVMNVSF